MAWQPGRSLEDIEKETILQAYRFYHQNKTMTANSLRIGIRTLDAKLEKYEKDERLANGESEESPADGVSASETRDMESTSQSAEERPVHLRKREKIQKVLS